MKWMYLLYWLFLWCSGEFWDKSLAEKLTQEQVLEELGVKIETKGKKRTKKYPVCTLFTDGSGHPKIRLAGFWDFASDVKKWVCGKLSKAFHHFLPNILAYI